MNNTFTVTELMWALERYNACGCVSFDYMTAAGEDGYAWLGFTDFSNVETDELIVTSVYFDLGKEFWCELKYDNLEDLMQIAGVLDCYDDFLHSEKTDENLEKWEETLHDFYEKHVKNFELYA